MFRQTSMGRFITSMTGRLPGGAGGATPPGGAQPAAAATTPPSKGVVPAASPPSSPSRGSPGDDFNRNYLHGIPRSLTGGRGPWHPAPSRRISDGALDPEIRSRASYTRSSTAPLAVTPSEPEDHEDQPHKKLFSLESRIRDSSSPLRPPPGPPGPKFPAGLPEDLQLDTRSIRSALTMPGAAAPLARQQSQGHGAPGIAQHLGATRQKHRSTAFTGASLGPAGSSVAMEDERMMGDSLVVGSNDRGDLGSGERKQAEVEKVMMHHKGPLRFESLKRLESRREQKDPKVSAWYCTADCAVPGQLAFCPNFTTFEPDPVHAAVKELGLGAYQVFVDLADVEECAAVHVPTLKAPFFPFGEAGGFIQLLLKRQNGRERPAYRAVQTMPVSTAKAMPPRPRRSSSASSVSSGGGDIGGLQEVSQTRFSASVMRSPSLMLPSSPSSPGTPGAMPCEATEVAFRSSMTDVKPRARAGSDWQKRPATEISEDVCFLIFKLEDRQRLNEVVSHLIDLVDARREKLEGILPLTTLTSVPFSSNAFMERYLIPRSFDETTNLSKIPSVHKDSFASFPTKIFFDIPDEAEALLTPHLAAQLAPHLPPTLPFKTWKLHFCTKLHGVSYQTLFRRTEEVTPCLLVIRDKFGVIFGGFTCTPLHRSRKYYGNAETFVFTFKSERSPLEPTYEQNVRVYQWTSKNSFFLFSDNKAIAIGGGGAYAVTVDSGLFAGSSTPCPTFNSPVLSATPDFFVSDVQVWGFEG